MMAGKMNKAAGIKCLKIPYLWYCLLWVCIL